MKKFSGLMSIAMVALACVVAVRGQEQPPAPDPATPQPQRRAPGPPHDPLANAFSPEMIMQHQRELGLTEQQRTLLRTEISKTSARFSDLQWHLHEAMEALHETMKAQIVNEQQALMQLDQVLEKEREIKRLHMELAIKIKNNLTLEQQQKLQNMRHERAPGPPGMGPGHGPGVPRRPPPGGTPGPGAPRTPRPEFEI